MGEIRTVTTLEAKRIEIRNTITRYERLIAQARADLAHVSACIRLFDAEGSSPLETTPYSDLGRLFKRGEMMGLIGKALTERGPLDTVEVAVAVLELKGLDTSDPALINSLTWRVIHRLRDERKKGRVVSQGKRRGRIVWAVAPLPLSG